MGQLGSRFGRNVPLGHAFPEPEDALLEPNPRTVSLELMTRDEFKPATTLNLLAAAWIQFEVHDWFSHGENEPEKPWQVALADDDPWPRAPDGRSSGRGAIRAPTPTGPPTFVDRRHPLVGRLADLRQRPGVRRRRSARASDGKLRIDDARPAARGARGSTSTSRGVAANFWLGLALLHALFMLRAQRDLRPAPRGAPGPGRRRALRQGATRQRGADGEDPHRRLDAGDHRRTRRR